MRVLRESYSEEDLITYIGTKLGLVDTKSVFKSGDNTNVNNLTDSTIEYLKKIHESGVREFKTVKVNNAWLTVKGASAARRNLKEQLAAYTFMYFTDGNFVEGSTKAGIKKYKSLKIDKDILSQKFEDLQDTLSAFGLVNVYPVQNTAEGLKDGMCLILSIKLTESNSVINTIQQQVKGVFSSDEDEDFLAKLSKTFISAFNKPVVTDLKAFEFLSSSLIKMYWTQEEEEIAEAILGLVRDRSSKKTNTDSKDQSDTNKNSSTKTKTKKKSFKKTFFGKQAQTVIKDPNKLQSFEDAVKELASDWNDKDAAVVAGNVANIMKHSYTKDKAELTKRLRDINLIEKVNRTKRLLENTYDDILEMFNFDLLENSVFSDKDECLLAKMGMRDLLNLLDDVAPTYLGIYSIVDIYEILDNSSDSRSGYYKELLDTCIENAKYVDQNS